MRPHSTCSSSLQRVARAPDSTMTFDFASSYLNAMQDHYYPTTCLQALVLVSIGDVLAQYIEPSRANSTTYSLDWRRTLRTGMLGIVIGGLGDAMWLRYLEEPGLSDPILRAVDSYSMVHEFTLDPDSLLVVLKAFLDAFVWAPIANTLYLVLTPLSEGVDLASVSESLSENFLPVMQSELSVCLPYNLLAFAFLPPFLRPFATGLFSMFFSTYLSWITHLEPKPLLSEAAAAGTNKELAMAAMTRDAREVMAAIERIDAESEAVPALGAINVA